MPVPELEGLVADAGLAVAAVVGVAVAFGLTRLFVRFAAEPERKKDAQQPPRPPG
jgi:hypothetical protein